MAERAVVFDKAAWHLDSIREHGLPDHQAYVHGGLFFGWAVGRGLHAPWLEQNTPEAFARFRAGEITGPQLLAAWDGAILDDMFNDMGLAFVVSYFDPRSGAYFSDYLQVVAQGLPSEFHVPDDADSARKVAALLDRRFEEWRASWDPSSGRPDLRKDPAEPVEAALPGELELGVIPVTSGVVLPAGLLGIRVARPGSIEVIEQALRADKRLGLIPYKGSRRVEYFPEHLLEVGVLAEIRSAERPAERPEVIDVSLGCLARFDVQEWTDEDALRARVRLRTEPEPTEPEMARLEEVRHQAADVVKRRVIRGEPPGLLALAATQTGAVLVDLVARELLLSREEALTVLEAPDLATRLDVVLSALAREP